MAQRGRSKLSRLLDRQLKAAERESSRLRQAARALWRQIKQRQISRTRERTVKLQPRKFVEEPGHHIEDDEHKLAECVWKSKRKQFRRNRIRHGHYDEPLSLRNIFNKGWKVVAVYRSRACGGSRFLAYNIIRQNVLLSEYTRDYCGICYTQQCCHDDSYLGNWDISEILEKPYHQAISHEGAFLAPVDTFQVVAHCRRVPGMKRRRLRPEDHGYQSLVTLYTAYTLFHSRVVQTRPSWEWPSVSAVKTLADWRPREWTRRRIEALVHVQAMWRGWLFRHRVLYSPHTELGCRYLLRAWHRDLEHYIPT